ncbi:MAG TPA: guanylate kinase [Opitutae bacterium]|nr:guanylate kinase [Opitutae bacterium]
MNNSTSQPGLLIIVSGPAGSGKTTLCDRMLAEIPELWRVVTSTTRKPRTGEKDHVDYYFFDHATFEQKIEDEHFYEYAHVHGNIYGTLKSEVQDKLAAGTDLLLNIDVQGAALMRATAQTDALLKGHVVTVFIMPRSLEELEQRLRGRASDSEEQIQRRMQVASDEMKQHELYDHTILSGSRFEDFEALQKIYLDEKAKRA